MVNEVTGAPAQETTPEPTLRETLDAVIEAQPVTEPGELQQREPSPARQEKARNQPREGGKFIKAAPEGAEVPSEEQVQQAQEPTARKEPQESEHASDEEKAAQGTSIDHPPKSWKAGPRERWASLDPEIRGEIHRRERESARAIGEGAPARKFVDQFRETVAPFASRYQGSGATPLQIFQNLMRADTILATAPMAQRAEFMAKLIQDYGIDIEALDTALSGGDPKQEPLSIVESLIEKKLEPLAQYVQTTRQREEQAQQRELSAQERVINEMADDVEKYPHFQLVSQDMADIMEMNARRRIYLSPEEAYKRAVAGNPEAQKAEQGLVGRQRAQVAHDAATRSLGASLSVSGAPAGLKQQVTPEDLRGTIEAAWAAASGR